MAGEPADHDQQALAAVRAEPTRLEGGRLGVVSMALPLRGRWGCGRGWPRQAALEWVPEGTMGRTPQPLVPDVVAPLGEDLRQAAADARQRRQGQGLPALVLGPLITAANLAVREREHPALGPRHPVDLPAPGAAPLFGPVPGRLAVDAPRHRPPRRGDGQIGTLPADASQEATSAAR
jgi:hypothetical protein